MYLHTVTILDIRVIAISYDLQCSSEHFAKVQFATISITFVKATGQSNKPLRLTFASLSIFLLFRGKGVGGGSRADGSEGAGGRGAH